MSEKISDTLTTISGIKYADFPDQWKALIDSFINDSKNSRLLLIPGENKSSTKLIVNPSRSDLISAENIVFIKTGSSDGEIILQKSKTSTDEIIAKLTDKFNQLDGTQSAIMSMLSEFWSHSKDAQIMSSLIVVRKKFLEMIINWSEESLIIENRSKLSLIQQISALKAKSDKMKAVLKVCDSLFNDVDNYPKSRQTIEQIIGEANEESEILFRKWCNNWTTINFDPNKACIETDAMHQPRVTFDPQLIALSKENRILQCLGFNMPKEIISKQNELSKYCLIARELEEVVNFYLSIGDQIIVSQRPILIESAKKFTKILKSKNKICWTLNESELNLWLQEVKNYAKKFDSQNRSLCKNHQKVLKLTLNLYSIPFNKWKPILNEISTIIYQIESNYSNTLIWKKHWNYQLYKILDYHFVKAINSANSWLGFYLNPFFNDMQSMAQSTSSSLRIDLCFTHNSSNYMPSLQEIKSQLYNRIDRFLNSITNFTGFNHENENNQEKGKNIFAKILLIRNQEIELLYKQAEIILQELIAIKDDFKEWFSLYPIVYGHGHDLEELKSLLGLKSLDDYRENLILTKSKAQDFTRKYLENEIQCVNSNIIINLAPIKMFINWLYDEVDRLLIVMLNNDTQNLCKSLDTYLAELLLQLTRNPEKMINLIQLEDVWYKQMSTIRGKVNQMYQQIENQHLFLLKWSSKSVINQPFDNLTTKYDQFNGLFKNRESIFDSFKQIMEQKINSKLQDLSEEVKILNRQWISTKSVNDQQFINQMKTQCDLLNADLEDIISGCEYFHIKQPNCLHEFESIQRQIIDSYTKLTVWKEFEDGLVNYLDMEWIIARHKLNIIENYIKQWITNCDNSDHVILSKLNEWKDFLPILRLCRGESFSKPHWQEFINLIELDKQQLDMENLKLNHLVEQRQIIIAKKEAIKSLNDQAGQEQSVRETFEELDNFYNNFKFDLFSHESDQQKVKLIKNWRIILNQISESILTLNLLKDSQLYDDRFGELINQWTNRLSTMDTIINQLNSVQRKWIYLQPIYSRNNQNDVFNDAQFVASSKEFISIMQNIEIDAHICKIVRINGVTNKLQSINSILNLCQKKLKVFLEQSRNRFARFFFLADDELLQVLAGKSSIGEASLLRKLFNNTINKIHFQGNQAIAIESVDGEVVKLRNYVAIKEEQNATEIENWLQLIENELQKTLKSDFDECLKNAKKAFNQKTLTFCSQIVNLVQWIKFTSDCEESIKRGKLKVFEADLIHQMSGLIDENNKSTEKVHKIKIKSMIMELIHFVDVVQYLMDENVSQIDDWRWIKQLRYYTDLNSDKIKVCMSFACVDYSFDFVGTIGSSKLVQTPLTDKCYLVCMQALNLGFGGNPYGPAGTGKTETVKALGQRLGRQVLVFNCDEALDVKSMVRILIGIIKCGSWGCFDEFNRLQVEVLSSLSSLIQAIQCALKNSVSKVILPSVGETELNLNSAIFVTLNPAGRQYKARNVMPDNLKALFLPVAMSVPDYSIICRVLLLSEGFTPEKSIRLAQKVASFFQIAADCMSHQKHYDWSLRAIKSTILSAGKILREMTNNIEDESLIIVEAIKRQIKSKLVNTDQQLFDALISDVFTDEVKSLLSIKFASDYEIDLQLVTSIMQEMNLIVDQNQIDEVFKLWEQLNSRLGVIILGESGCGKTTIRQLLAKFISKKKSLTINEIIINPKSMNRSQLLGFTDLESREWNDGVFSRIARTISRDESDQLFWIIFDGDIDPEWIEALNSVLDDNRILTLSSGERIDFDGNKVSLIFETISLDYASPATISRVGIISLSQLRSELKITSSMMKMGLNVSISNVLQFVEQQSESLSNCANTIISLLNHAQINGQDYYDNFSLLDQSSSLTYHEPFLRGNLVVTSSLMKIVKLIEIINNCPLNHFILLGNQCCGKFTLVDEIVLRQSRVTLIKIFCGPHTQPEVIINQLKSKLNLTSNTLKSKDGTKLVIFVRNLEFIKSDKWSSIRLVSFLICLINNNGFYDPQTSEWLNLSKFQVIISCSQDYQIDSRLMAIMNVLKMPNLSVNDIQSILLLKCSDSTIWCKNFITNWFKVCQNLTSSSSNNLILLGRAIMAMQMIKRYDKVNNQVLWFEFYQSLNSLINESESKRLMNILDSILGAQNSFTKITFTSSKGIELIESSEAIKQINTIVNDWIEQSEIKLDLKIALIPEVIELFNIVAAFLFDFSNQIKGLLLIGASGSGRKIACKSMANHYGFDEIWYPKNEHEKHVTSELRNLITNENEKRTLIIIDYIHFQLMPFIQQIIYDLLMDSDCKKCIRIVIVAHQLSEEDHMRWSKNCYIYRTRSWSDKSLIDLAKNIVNFHPLMSKEKEGNSKMDNLWTKGVKLFRQLNDDGNNNDCRKFLALIEMFIKIKVNKLSRFDEQKSRLQLGVSKLEKSANEVGKLKEDAKTQQNILNLKRNDADLALNMIASSMHNSEDQKIELEEIKAKTEKESMILKNRKQEIENELKEIEPILMAAKSAVGGIKSESLSEIKALRAPPEVIRDILEGVIRLMGVHDTSWVSMKSFLSRRGIREEIMNFDARKISPLNREKVEQLMKSKANSFTEMQAKRASIAAQPLAEWVKANLAFAKILHKIKPLEDEQNRLEAGLRSAQGRMRSLSSELAGVETEVDSLKNRLNQVTLEAAEIEVNLNRTNSILQQSENLLTDLNDEYERWKKQLQSIQQSMNILDKQCFIASFYIIFIARQSSPENRDLQFAMCCDLLQISKFDLQLFMDVNSEADVFYSQSINLLTPLLLDSDRKSESSLLENGDLIDVTRENWLKKLELCIRFGKIAILENLTSLNLIVLDIIKHQIYGGNGLRTYLLVGDRKIDINDNFVLIIKSSDNFDQLCFNPYLRVINMISSKQSTFSQLLSLTISIRKPELEERKSLLESEKSLLKKKLSTLEDELLIKLSCSSSDNFLNDEQLIASLKEIKTSCKEIENSLINLNQIDEDIVTQRNEYKSLADLGCQLYHLSQELIHLNRMYTFGMQEFQSLYCKCLTINRNISSDKLLQNVYNYISQALFPIDRLIFKRFLSTLKPTISSDGDKMDSLNNNQISNLQEYLNDALNSPDSQRIVLIITASGADPTSEIRESVSSLNLIYPNPVFISMGSDVLPQMDTILTNNQDNFICLANCHLVVDWLPQLRNKLLDLAINKETIKNDEDKKREFFLVLVTHCHDRFPKLLLEMCLKYVYTSSPGLGSLVGGLKMALNQQQNDDKIKNLLTLFHAVCCERRNYIPIGWTKYYDFGFNDFRNALIVLDKMQFKRDHRIQLQYVKGIIETIFYGAKLDTQMDVNILSALIRHWFSHGNSLINDHHLFSKANELSLLSLSSNLSKWRVDLFDEKNIAKGLKILSKAVRNDDQELIEINRLKEILKSSQIVTSSSSRSRRSFSAVKKSSSSMPSAIINFIESEKMEIGKIVEKLQNDLECLPNEIRESVIIGESADNWFNWWPSGSKNSYEFVNSICWMRQNLAKLSTLMQISEYDLSCYLRPISLISAIRQTASRELGISMDELEMKCIWSDRLLKSINDHGKCLIVKIYGISIEGAFFDGSILSDCESNSNISNSVPPLNLCFVDKKRKSEQSMESVALPLYGSSTREVLVTWFDLPCSTGTQDYWTMRGTALTINSAK